MRAVVITSFDAVPRAEDFAEPEPRAGEQLVTVLAAGVHPIVRAMADGTHYGKPEALPAVAGVDGVGRNDAGRPVYFGFLRPPFGTMAERAAVPERGMLPLPEDVDPVAVAGTLNPAMAGWLALTVRGGFQPGMSVLVLGATGASGGLTVQAARALGADRVIAAGRNPAMLAALHSRADNVVDLAQPDDVVTEALRDAIGDGVDLVVDHLWGRPTELTIAALARTGLTHTARRTRLVEVGDTAGPTIALPGAVLRSSAVEIVGSGAGSVPVTEIARAVPEIVRRVTSGEFRTEVRAVPLEQVETVWTDAGARVVLVP